MKTTACYNRPIVTPCTLENRNYQVDPYIGCEHYCYYCYVLGQAETDWRKEVRVHADLAERLKLELSEVPPQTIYMGWHTDPYQPCEAECRQTRQVLEILLENGFSASILTKSDLVLRDMDILQAMNAANVSFSVAFTDENVRQLFEAKTKATAARIAALQELKGAGIHTSSLLCPVIPYVTDVERCIDLLAAHADKIWIYGISILNRSDRNWRYVEKIIQRHFPELKTEIEAAVFSREHAYWESLRQKLLQLQSERSLNLNIHV